jgi:uncharacterized protein YggU (UPF0235/DUF167 family)
MNPRILHEQVALLTSILAALAARESDNTLRVSKHDIDLREGKKIRMKVVKVSTPTAEALELRFEEER